MRAQVIVLAGPSGSGKSRLAERLGLPVLRLDHFYRDGTGPALPHLDQPLQGTGPRRGRPRGDASLAGGEPIVDWDDPASWHAAEAVAAIQELCRTGSTDAPVYEFSTNRRTGHRVLDLGDSAYFVAEGIFASEVVSECTCRDLVSDALCVTQHPALTFVRRLSRDLRERRKPPFYLLRRGLHLLADQRKVVARAERMGCRVVTPDTAYREIQALTRPSTGG